MDDDPPARSRKSLAVTLVVLSAAFFGLVLIAPYAAAQDMYVSGPITKDTTWAARDTYFVVGDVTVMPGINLTIEPGTSVYFDPGRALFVEGMLTADGLQSSMIRFLPNASILPITWTGIQFNASSSGSVTWSSFLRPDRAVTAIDSSPAISNNFVDSAGWGFALLRSSTYLADNVVNRSGVGIYVAESDVQVVRNQVNGSTLFGIRAETSGAVEISDNTITNTRSPFAIGIYTSGVTPTISGNWIQGIYGRDGSAGGGPGVPGEDGGPAIGIFVDGVGSATVLSNAIDSISGGRGGNGAANSGATGGRGGSGGPAAGIVLANVGTADVEWNSVTNIFGGRGGTGGQGGGTSTGGAGGAAGDAAAIQVVVASTAAWYYGNAASTILGGVGGHGGDGSFVDGTGGSGGDAIGISSWGAMDADASGNTFQTLRGGLGGNSTVLGGGNRAAGTGGAGTGVALFGPAGSSIVHSNSVLDVSGGDGGRGSPGGAGGDATGVIALGNNDGLFNATSITSNSIEQIAGGDGGIGSTRGGAGGGATGIAGILATASLAWNWILDLQGGSGAAGAAGGRGGDAVGIVGAVVRGFSVGDSMDSVNGGSPGSPPPPEVALGMGVYVAGSASFTSQFTIDNLTLSSVADYDFLAADYADVTTINAIVVDGRLSVWPAGNLTVRNFLGIEAVWPDGFTLVPGVGILVEDDAGTVWDFVSSSGQELWLLVTDRVYVNSNTATEIPTKVSVNYGSEGFQNNPRDVVMATSHTESFVMIDAAAPTAAATPLPMYETALTFSVGYTASDGNGTGLGNITLWYRTGGGWTAYATQPASGVGQFTFTASAEGLHEFATTVDDRSGNQEPGPNANETWTIVDTIRPASRVDALPPYETSSSFVVSWAPETGVTDIVRYNVQYNAGAGWVDWLVDTSATSATFTAGTQGPYAFRSIAEDAAGNVETVAAGNDTWTIVDTLRPSSRVLPLTTYQTSASFVVTWGPQFDTTDIAAYRIEVRDNGGAWTVWIASTTATFSTYSGEDSHSYEFRSIAQDRAGNVETTGSANDTWTIVDTTAPTITAFAPSGTSVGPTSPIVITFSEPMNTTTTEAAVSITPSSTGAFSWNANRTVLTIVASNPLSDQTQYTVVIGSGARDRAGNTVSQRVFQFTTAGAIPTATSFVSDFWWVFLVVGAVAGASLFLVMRRRRAATASKVQQPATAMKPSEAIVEDVFLLYHRDGLLIKHETRRLRPDIDTDILSGMLTAVQAFVKDALRGDDSGDLNEMTVGHMHILIGRGKWLVLAARIEGDGSESWTDQIQRCIQDMEDHQWDQLEDWDGDMALAGVLAPYVKKLIRGEYA